MKSYAFIGLRRSAPFGGAHLHMSTCAHFQREVIFYLDTKNTSIPWKVCMHVRCESVHFYFIKSYFYSKFPIFDNWVS